MEYKTIKPKVDLVQVMSNNDLIDSDNISFIHIGRYDEENLFRVLFKIFMNKIPQNVKIIDATLIINIKHVGSGYPNIITTYALMENWGLEGVTWENQPHYNTKISGESINVSRRSQCKLKITSIIKKWYKNEISNYGIVLKNNEIKDKTTSKIVGDMDAIVQITYSSKNIIGKDLNEKCPPQFTEKVERFDTDDLFGYSTLRNTSLKSTVIFLVENLGTNIITAHLQVSPDGINFIDEPFKVLIEMNEIKYLVPCIFSKFTRVAVKNINSVETSTVKIWYQAQK